MESIGLLFKVLWSPGEALSRVATSRKAMAPLILLTLASIGFGFVRTSYINDGEIALKVLEQRQTQLTQEQKDQIVAQSNSPVVKGIGVVVGALVPTLTILVASAVFFGVFTLIGREGGFKSYFAVTALAHVPMLLRLIVSAVMVATIPQSSLALDEIGSISPSLLLDRAGMSKVLFTLINSIDVVSIWIVILLIIGYRFVTTKKVSTALRIVGVLGAWLVWVLIRVALAPFLGS